jgi:hypothetical protein
MQHLNQVLSTVPPDSEDSISKQRHIVATKAQAFRQCVAQLDQRTQQLYQLSGVLKVCTTMMRYARENHGNKTVKNSIVSRAF